MQPQVRIAPRGQDESGRGRKSLDEFLQLVERLRRA
jgi:hypothetical protein